MSDDSRNGRTPRVVIRGDLPPGEARLRRLIAECFDVDENLVVTDVEAVMLGVRWFTPSDACLIGPNGPDVD